MRNINSTVMSLSFYPTAVFRRKKNGNVFSPAGAEPGCWADDLYLTGTNIMQPCLVALRVIVGRALASGKPAAPRRSQSREVHSRR